jgi:NACHT domain
MALSGLRQSPRPSRDGDQFHYLWAARRCLLLLLPDSGLAAITIEGSSPSEAPAGQQIIAGEQKIDVAEYYGSEDLVDATQIHYIQLKHSTLHSEAAWLPSELADTLKGFAARYKVLLTRFGEAQLVGRFEFWFVSNRPVSADFLAAVQDTSRVIPARHPGNLAKLEQSTNLSGTELAIFCSLLRLEGNIEGLWDQRNMLSEEVGFYLADADVDAPVQLKELVTRKALSASASNPRITRTDVLRALGTDENRLFPAPCLIENIEHLVPRFQEPVLLQSIAQAHGVPVVIHADGGVGKSVFAKRIGLGLPQGSWSVLYDCFANGQYRRASAYRHRHKDALVQMANELSAKGLCHPLIPSASAEPSEYLKAFLHRLRQSVESLRSQNAEAVLCIVIDAADNAQMAAEEAGDARAFVRDLIREQIPDGVRLVVLCRTHRRQRYLDPPPNALNLELEPFSRDETANYLRQFFAEATKPDVAEFHRLSSRNPRVQALALSRDVPLAEILRALGPNPTSLEDAIEHLLHGAIARLRDTVGVLEKQQIDNICAGLAALRPLIPLSVLSTLAGVETAAIRSFAIDLGRPLLLSWEYIQFFDEPAESWFVKQFKPQASALSAFVEILRPLASNSAYVASVLPQLMLEAGQFTALVELALSTEALPDGSLIEKRDIQLQRLQFALKASLRAKRYAEAAKLALKAGGESAGDERQRKLLQENTDLAARFLGSERIEELVSRRAFGSGWKGSHHAYEAGLLSGRTELLGDARSRLRMAGEWLQNWSELSSEDRERERIEDEDLVEIATAFFNIHGAQRCAENLGSWRPNEISFRVGRMLARRFVDGGRFYDLDSLAVASEGNTLLTLAIILELRAVRRTPPKNVILSTLRVAKRIKVNVGNRWDHDGNTIRAISALVEVAHQLSLDTTDNLINLLTRFLPASPPRGLSSQYSPNRSPYLAVHALRAQLAGESLRLVELAHDELRHELESPKGHSESGEVREFTRIIGFLLPWYLIWARAVVNRTTSGEIADEIAKAQIESSKAERIGYHGAPHIANECALVWFDTLVVAGATDDKSVGEFNKWIASPDRRIWSKTLTQLARLSGRISPLEPYSLEYAEKAHLLFQNAREHAETISSNYVSLARAVLTVSHSEAIEYFNKGVEVASKVGDENLDRWGALLDLADYASLPDQPDPEIAYRLARCAELTYAYVDRDKHFDWRSTVEAIAGLCGNSSLAILSRWRDRSFDSPERTLPIAVNFLVAKGQLDPRSALTLTCIRADWQISLLLKSALTVCATKAEKITTATFAFRHMSLNTQSIETWRKLKCVLMEHGIVLEGLDERMELSQHEDQASQGEKYSYGEDNAASTVYTDKRDWDLIFNGIDLSVPNDISRARRKFRDGAPPYSTERFFEEAFRRVSVGHEADFIMALTDATDFSIYDLRELIDQIPVASKGRLAVKTAIKHLLTTYCRRFCMSITKSRYYQVLPLKAASELSGQSEVDLHQIIVDAISEGTEIVGAGRLFTLVGLLAPMLTRGEAYKSLSFGLSLFDEVLVARDGDGPWTSGLIPPPEIEASVAGYVWSRLGDPRASVRWEAAHSVRALCTLERVQVLTHLIANAKGASANTFADTGFHFYALHARQWLLIGLARAAMDHPDLVAAHADFLIKVTFDDEPHALIREFGKRSLLAILDAGLLASRVDLRERLSTVNVSLFPNVESRSNSCIEPDIDGDEPEIDEDDRFIFGIDFGPYWLAPLGRCFGKLQGQIDREVLRVIRNDWGIKGGIRWDADERHRRKIFADGATIHSHGSLPRVDDLQFYLSYHAMMVEAGKLLTTSPVHHGSIDADDDFLVWLQRHDLSRPDGRWLADRRDPPPNEWPNWKNEKQTDEWLWSIEKCDFDQVLTTSDGRINVWGNWTRLSGHRRESIHIASALVSSNRSHALLRALQCVDNPFDYRIPPADDYLEIDANGFNLKGWIGINTCDVGLEELDPWAGDIRFPPPEPAPYIRTLMKIGCADEDRRIWITQSSGEEVAWSQVWGKFSEHNHDESEGERGYRLQAAKHLLSSLLQQLGMDMIVEVQIKRQRTRPRWESGGDDAHEFIPPSTRLFIFKANGTFDTI